MGTVWARLGILAASTALYAVGAVFYTQRMLKRTAGRLYEQGEIRGMLRDFPSVATEVEPGSLRAKLAAKGPGVWGIE